MESLQDEKHIKDKENAKDKENEEDEEKIKVFKKTYRSTAFTPMGSYIY